MYIENVDETKLEALSSKVISDEGGAFSLFVAFFGEQASQKKFSIKQVFLDAASK